MVAKYQNQKPTFDYVFTNLSYYWKVFIRANREQMKDNLTQHDKKTLKRMKKVLKKTAIKVLKIMNLKKMWGWMRQLYPQTLGCHVTLMWT